MKNHSILTPLFFVDVLYSGNNEVNQTSSNKKKKTSKLKYFDDDDFVDFQVSTNLPKKLTDSLPSSQKYHSVKHIAPSEYKIHIPITELKTDKKFKKTNKTSIKKDTRIHTSNNQSEKESHISNSQHLPNETETFENIPDITS